MAMAMTMMVTVVIAMTMMIVTMPMSMLMVCMVGWIISTDSHGVTPLRVLVIEILKYDIMLLRKIWLITIIFKTSFIKTIRLKTIYKSLNKKIEPPLNIYSLMKRLKVTLRQLHTDFIFF